MSRRRPALPRSADPLDCVILAIDPGATSGWALLAPCVGRALGTVDRGFIGSGSTTREHADVVRRAMELAAFHRRPLVVVGEKWTTGNRWNDRRMNAATLAGLGAAWGAWAHVLREAGHPKRRTLRVLVSDWRAAVLSLRVGTPREEAKARARWRARLALGREPLEDEAEACCIALWAAHAGEVAAVLPVGRSRSALALRPATARAASRVPGGVNSRGGSKAKGPRKKTPAILANKGG